MKKPIPYFVATVGLILTHAISKGQTDVRVVNPNLSVTVAIPATPDPISRDDFSQLQMNIVSADFKSGIWTFTGYTQAGGNVLQPSNVALLYNQVYADWAWAPKWSFAVVTVPFKVRKSIDTFPQTVQASLTNIGLGINFWNLNLNRYLPTGTKSTHRFGAGFIVAPSFEDLSPATTHNYVNKISKQLFISASINFNYTYNDISFYLIPVGFDFATTIDGKQFIYNKKRWWGIGIGLSTKLLGWR